MWENSHLRKITIPNRLLFFVIGKMYVHNASSCFYPIENISIYLFYLSLIDTIRSFAFSKRVFLLDWSKQRAIFLSLAISCIDLDAIRDIIIVDIYHTYFPSSTYHLMADHFYLFFRVIDWSVTVWSIFVVTNMCFQIKHCLSPIR